MIEDFYLSCVPEQIRVLGFALRPLSLGHIILLHRVESAFACGGSPDFNDLAISVLICSLKYKEALNAFSDPDLDEFMRRWHARLSGLDKWAVRLGLRKPKLVDFAVESAEFTRYLALHTKIPYYSFKEDDFSEIQCPPAQIVKVSLMRDMGFSESELLDRSWLLCLWDHVTLKALAGHVRMGGEREISDALSAASLLSELLAQGKVKATNGNP